MFERPHHQRIALVLQALRADMLMERDCLFGGGTAIALRFGEYRESVDLDFMVSNLASYRELRLQLTGPQELRPLFSEAAADVIDFHPVRADQYGIRTWLGVGGGQIKFEIVLEGRIALQAPGPSDRICAVATLTSLDMVTSKLLANADRWRDDGVFSRDIIDLAMMQPKRALLMAGFSKAEVPYGKAVRECFDKAIAQLKERDGWLQRCMSAMQMELPRAVLCQHLRALEKAAR